MGPGQTPYNTEPSAPAPRPFGRKTVLLIILFVVLVGAAGGGVYVWQQQKIQDLEDTARTKSQQKTAVKDKAAAQTSTPKSAKFAQSPVPFTLSYPSGWTRTVDEPLQQDQPLPESYAITLTQPGSIITTTALGSEVVAQGSRIVITSTATDLQDINERFTGAYESVQNKKTTTVDSIDAVEYTFGYETDPGIYTDFVKDGRLYSIGFFSDKQNEKDSPGFATYQSVVNSLKLN